MVDFHEPLPYEHITQSIMEIIRSTLPIKQLSQSSNLFTMRTRIYQSSSRFFWIIFPSTSHAIYFWHFKHTSSLVNFYATLKSLSWFMTLWARNAILKYAKAASEEMNYESSSTFINSSLPIFTFFFVIVDLVFITSFEKIFGFVSIWRSLINFQSRRVSAKQKE